MTIERIKELRHMQNFGMSLKALHLGLRECLDEIERLQGELAEVKRELDNMIEVGKELSER